MAVHPSGPDHPHARAEEPDPLERPLDDEIAPLSPASAHEVPSAPTWTPSEDYSASPPPTLSEAVPTGSDDTASIAGVSSERIYDDAPSPEHLGVDGDQLAHLEDASDHITAFVPRSRSDNSEPMTEVSLDERMESVVDSARDTITTEPSAFSVGEEVTRQTAQVDFLHVEDRRATVTPAASNVTGDDEALPAPPAGDHSGEARRGGFFGGIGSAVGSVRESITGRAAVTERDGHSDTDAAESGPAAPDPGSSATDRGIDGPPGRTQREPGVLLDPSLRAATTVPQRMVLIAGVIGIFLSLLSNNAGLALVVASAIVPVTIALALNQRDLFEKESTTAVAAVGGAGLAGGVIVALLASWIANSTWFSYGTLNYGAAGFGGRFSNLAGSPPFSVWLLNGLVYPLLALVAIVAGPIAMRRWPQFRNEVMDGVILCGTSAAGFAIGSAIVYWAPMVSGRGPQTDVADWTLSIFGVSLLRPMVITLAGAMLGAGVWKYASSPSISAIFLPALGSVGGMLLLSLGSLQFGPSGLWPEVVWTALVAIGSFMIYRLVLNSAISSDRAVIGEDRARVVCPNCRKITPAGTFCAHCGTTLDHVDEVPEPAPASGA